MNLEKLTLENTVSAGLMLSGRREYRHNETVLATKLPFELFLCAEEGSFLIDTGEKQIAVSEGEAVLVPCDTEYTLDVCEESAIVFAAVSLFVYSNLRVFSLFDFETHFGGDTGREITALCKELCSLFSDREFTNARLENAVKMQSDIYRLARTVLDGALPKSGGSDIMERHEKLAEVLQYIHVNIRKNILQ